MAAAGEIEYVDKCQETRMEIDQTVEIVPEFKKPGPIRSVRPAFDQFDGSWRDGDSFDDFSHSPPAGVASASRESHDFRTGSAYSSTTP